jgi:asparagine synthase (glutamine-hydrolysing)
MCGIVGIASSRSPVSEDLLAAQRDTLRHRGPDGAGSWSSTDGRVGFGHRRLAIVDLSAAGHQPMSDSEGGLEITFNGEIYNFRELRRELESHGARFKSDTDTEVILAAYRLWGVDCLDHFVGMFAFGIYDARANALFIARDRIGEKPLFYAHTQGRLTFASELKALLADPSVPRKMDPAAVEWYLAYGYVPTDRCILAGVQKLRAAHALWYDLAADSVKIWRYWQPPTNLETGARASADELADELTQLLGNAVRMQLMADVPVGILLSGGVDSSLVTALAARVSSAPVRTFTVAFPQNKTYDEAPFARQVASHFGTLHTELVLEPPGVDLLPILARQYDEPIADSSMIPTYLISRLIREHATVALGGDGGDELFGGYPHYSWLLRQERPRRLIPRSVRSLVAAGAGALPVGTRGRNHLVGMGDPFGGLSYVNMYFDAPTRRSLVPFLRHTEGSSPEEIRGASYQSGGSILRRATLADLEGFLVDDILVKVDRASMLCSLEIRAPFLDHRVVEFAFGKVPDRFRADGSRRKILPRLLAERLLPPEFDAVRKRGFTLPLADWFRGDWGTFFESTLLSAPKEFLDPGVVSDLIRRQRSGFSNVDRLFGLAMLELWRREYNVEGPN